MEALADEVDVIFTATPQGFCASLVNEGILNKVKVIDLSADFRIKDVKVIFFDFSNTINFQKSG